MITISDKARAIVALQQEADAIAQEQARIAFRMADMTQRMNQLAERSHGVALAIGRILEG
jgi:hypothetical protein